ncbi:putative cell wall protein [Aristolochia californica]|uniref:putative cell wall protein n=1 Tax=Aristolochia californica TaxID=171875 RepID=UPI0035DC364D
MSSSTFLSFFVIFFLVSAIPSLRVTVAGREIPTSPKETSMKKQPEFFNGGDRGFLIPGIGRFMVPPFGDTPITSSDRNSLPSSSGGNGVEAPTPASSGSLHP